MARTIESVPYQGDFKTTKAKIEQMLLQSGFSQTTIGSGETVWKKGTGALTAMQFIKIEYGTNELTISAWVSMGIGKFTANEMNLDGLTAIVAKKPLRKLVNQLKILVS